MRAHATERRSRAFCAAAFILTLAAGYLSRKIHLFPAAFGKYPGDALWALMVYWLIACLRPAIAITQAALITLILSVGVEFLKLAQTPWLVAARHSTFGALIRCSRVTASFSNRASPPTTLR